MFSAVPSCCCRRQAFESYVAAVKKLEDAAQQETRASFRVGQARHVVVVLSLKMVPDLHAIDNLYVLPSQGAISRRAPHVMLPPVARNSMFNACQPAGLPICCCI